MQISIGNKVFRHKKEAKEYFKSILCDLNIGQSVTEESYRDDLRHLIRRHPEAGKKVGAGIKRFYVGGDNHGHKCLWIEREDGSSSDFSIDKCIDDSQDVHAKDVRAAFRNCVRDSIIEAKKKFINDNCKNGFIVSDLSKKPVPLYDVNIDHMPPLTFQVIVFTFCAANRLRLSDIELEGADTLKQFADKKLASRFLEYHNSVANLRAISKEENASIIQSNLIRFPSVQINPNIWTLK